MIYSLPKLLKRIDTGLWGIDMQVTDKMIKAALESWFGEPVNEPYDEHVDNMRFAIQAAIQAAWVSVECKLPPAYSKSASYSLPVLVISNSFIPPKNNFPTTHVTDFNTETGVWSGYENTKQDITHWMPLPEFKE